MNNGRSLFVHRKARIARADGIPQKIFVQKSSIARSRVCYRNGRYRLDVNGVKAGDRYFAPGFTSYKHTLQYQTYDVTALAEENTEFVFIVAGGWAVGSFGSPAQTEFRQTGRPCLQK